SPPADAPRSLPDGGPPLDPGPHRVVSAGAGMLALTRGPDGSDVGQRRERGGTDAGWGGRDLGHFGPRAATVPIRSSRLSGAPQRPRGAGTGRAESTDRCAAASQPSRTHSLW